MRIFRIAWRGWFPVVLLLALLSLWEGALAAETYTWLDAEGRRHFSDRPPLDGLRHAPLTLAPLWSPGKDYPAIDSKGSRYLSEPENAAPDRVPRPQKKTITAADYDLSPTILISGRDLSVRGRINGGPECANLKLQFSLRNEHGRMVVVSTLVENAGGHFGSTIYAGASRLKKSSYGQHWEVVDRQVICD